MSDNVDTASLAGALEEFERVVDALQTLDLTTGTDASLLDAHRRFEQLRRRLEPVEYRLIAQERERQLPRQYLCRSTGRFLRHLLRIDPGEANARARAAEATGPRRTLTGEVLPPVFEHVAAAQQAGVISQRHALLIEKTIDDLPDAVQAESGEQVERDLVKYAADFDPKHLSVLARRIANCLDPDGTLGAPDEQQRRRGLVLHSRADGTSSMTIRASGELTARMRACFDTFAAPKPANADGVRDPRTLPQRQHDALLDLLEFAQPADDAPSNNGVSLSVVVTMTAEQYLTGTGLCRTSHGGLVNVGDALTWSGGDYDLFAVALNSMGAITHHGHTHRLFTENQRRAMAARDGGCSFPGCPEPPGRCQADHIRRHEHHGPTSVTNGQLVCRYHHREANRLGYHALMINGRPHWQPPIWIDPQQRPVRNTLHDTNPAA